MVDLIIRNAHVLDGTGAEPFYSDVAIQNGKIAAMARQLRQPAAEEIDLHGLTLCPGFIDAHSHGDVILKEEPSCIAEIEQGVTTQIAGMCGISPSPMSRRFWAEGLRVTDMIKAHETQPEPEERERFGAFLASVDQPIGTNMAFLVGHGALRAAVVGYADRKVTAEELAQMQTLLRSCMEDGAYGLSFGLIYPPGSYCDVDEMAALCSMVAEYGGVMTVHLRSENDRLVEAVEEMLEVTRRSGVRCVISHHKATGGKKNWGKTEQTLKLMDAMNEQGFDVFCDQYPYTASSTGLATAIPNSLHALGTEAVIAMLQDPEGRRKLRETVVGKQTAHERFQYTMIGASASHPSYAGRMLNELADELGADPFDLDCEILADDRLLTSGIFHTMSEEDLRRVMQCRRAMIGSDGVWYPGCRGTHPRSIGTFPRYLGHYVREKKLITLPEAIRKITSLPAQVYSLKGKGLVREGFDADLVAFDPDTIIDRADYANYRRRCEGLQFVMVGGRIAVRDAVFNGTRNGKVLRRAD